MKLRSRLLLYTTIVCMILAGVMGFLGVDDLEKSGKRVSELAVSQMKSLGERIIQNRAEHVASLIHLYLKNHPELQTIKQIKADRTLESIAVQQVGKTGYTDVLDNHGNAVFHPNPDVVGRNYKKWENKYPQMWGIVEKSLSGKKVSGYYRFLDMKDESSEKYMSVYPVKDSPLLVCATTFIEEFSRPLSMVNKQIEKITKQSVLRFVAGTFFVIGLAIPGVIWISGQFTRPVEKLIDISEEIGRGNLNVSIDFNAPSEISSLAASMKEMGVNLEHQIYSLEETTRQKERYEADLRHTLDLQKSMLPEKINKLGIYETAGLYSLAEEPDGAFFDFMHIDGSAVAMMIGEGASRGLESVLHAMRVRSAFRIFASEKNLDVCQYVLKLNDALKSIDKPFQMSCLIAVLDTTKDILSYVSSGDFTYIASTGQIEKLEGNSTGQISAGKPDVNTALMQSDCIYGFFSRHFFQAVNNNGETLVPDDILGFLNKYASNDLEEVKDKLKQKLSGFFNETVLLKDMVAVLIKAVKPSVQIDLEKPKKWSPLNDRIIERLFSDCSKVALTPVAGGFSGAYVFKVLAYDNKGRIQMPYILKLGRADLIEKEKNGYYQHVSKYIQNNATQVLASELIEDMGGIVYNFLGMKSEDSELFSLYEYYKANNVEKVVKIIDVLFRDVLKNWYGQSRLEEMSLAAYYGKLRFYPMIQGYLKKYQNITEDAEYIDSGKFNEKLINPLYFTEYVLPEYNSASSQVYTAAIHGDLNLKNVMMDDKENLWLIDFSDTRAGHILVDFAKLESSILFDLIPVAEDSFDDLKKLSEHLLSIDALDKLPEKTEWKDSELDKAYKVICKIREYVNLVTVLDNDVKQYFMALFYFSAPVMGYKNVDYTIKEYAFYHSSMLATRLTEILSG